MATVISLSDLVNLSIGTPEVGAVNFNALHTLLHAIIKNLNIQDVKANIPEEETGPYNPPKGPVKAMDQEGQNDWVPNGNHRVERKILKLEQQLQALNSLPTALDLMGRAKTQQDGSTPVEDMWNMMQMKKRLEANEDGVCQAMTVLQDLLHEINALKVSQQEAESRLQKVIESMQQDKVRELEQRLTLLEIKTATKGDVDNLQIEHQSVQNKLKALEDKLTEFPTPDKLSNMVQWETLHETLVRRPVNVDAQPSYILPIGEDTTTSKTSLVGRIMLQVPTSSASIFQVEAPQIGEVPKNEEPVHNTVQTKLNMAQEPTGKSSLSASETLKELIQVNGEECTPISYQANITSQKPEDKSHAHPEGPASEQALATLPFVNQEHAHPPGSPGDDFSFPNTINIDETTRIPGLHTTARLRVLDDSNHSSPTPCTPNKATPPHTPSSSQGSTPSHRYADTVEALRKIGALSEEHALLQARVETLERVKADRAELSMLQRSTAEHLRNLSDLQEKLNSLYRDMQELKSNGEKIIYQTLEKLEEQKADKDHAEMKQTHMSALDGKVSRSQFDATTEQLNSMMQELLGKVSGQEQDWQRVLEKINLEMQRKLDRMELDPLKNKLEERWKEIRRQLQEKPPQYNADDAAGIRKQLFHCLSCDRPIDMMVPGPPILTIPNIPGLPSHRSYRPFTVYELDQIRQWNRNDRIADITSLGYAPNNRSCGGSHTLTFPNRRYVRMQGIASCSFQEEDLIAVGIKEETDVMGSDGQIYHGRMDTSLPAIHVKDGKSKRGKHLQGSQKSLLMNDVSVPPTRPQSAKSIVSLRKTVLDAQIPSLT
ncbi:glutamine-rich protein 2 isoform X2 [Lithobates pipiens]